MLQEIGKEPEVSEIDHLGHITLIVRGREICDI
jgi:hypothetical protein